MQFYCLLAIWALLASHKASVYAGSSIPECPKGYYKNEQRARQFEIEIKQACGGAKPTLKYSFDLECELVNRWAKGPYVSRYIRYPYEFTNDNKPETSYLYSFGKEYDKFCKSAKERTYYACTKYYKGGRIWDNGHKFGCVFDAF